MRDILTSLQELDQLYNQDTLVEYEEHWKIAARLVQQMFPGFTIAYAELYNSGISRLSDAAMSHVLVPVTHLRENGNPQVPETSLG